MKQQSAPVVVVTRFEREDGRVIVHAYGPFSTRGRARTIRDRMLIDAREKGHQDRLSVHLCALINIDSDVEMRIPNRAVAQ